jgi:hypothetical protein
MAFLILTTDTPSGGPRQGIAPLRVAEAAALRSGRKIFLRGPRQRGQLIELILIHEDGIIAQAFYKPPHSIGLWLNHHQNCISNNYRVEIRGK